MGKGPVRLTPALSSAAVLYALHPIVALGCTALFPQVVSASTDCANRLRKGVMKQA